MDYFSVEPRWRFEARFEPYEPPKALKIPNIIGTVETQPSPGAVVFEADGAVHRLDAVAGDDSLFLVFGDETNGAETYGGGRFLYTRIFNLMFYIPTFQRPSASLFIGARAR